jgi:hypothetical protein
MDCDEHLLAMAADSGHSGDAGDADPDLETDPDPRPAVGVVEHLDAAKRWQRHTKVAVNCLGVARPWHEGAASRRARPERISKYLS